MDFQPSIPTGPSLTPAVGKKSSLLRILLVIAAVLVVLALWVWFYGGSLLPSPKETYNSQPTIGIKPPTEPDVAVLQKQSVSDDITVIENDLNATDLENLDLELDAIDKEFAQ